VLNGWAYALFVFDDVANHVKRIRQARCRQENKRW